MKTLIAAILFSAFLDFLCPFWSALIHAAVDMGHWEFIVPPAEAGEVEP